MDLDLWYDVSFFGHIVLEPLINNFLSLVTRIHLGLASKSGTHYQDLY